MSKSYGHSPAVHTGCWQSPKATLRCPPSLSCSNSTIFAAWFSLSNRLTKEDAAVTPAIPPPMIAIRGESTLSDIAISFSVSVCLSMNLLKNKNGDDASFVWLLGSTSNVVENSVPTLVARSNKWDVMGGGRIKDADVNAANDRQNPLRGMMLGW